MKKFFSVMLLVLTVVVLISINKTAEVKAVYENIESTVSENETHIDIDENKFCDICGEYLSELIETDKCGDSVKYDWYKDGTVIISGEGPMWDCINGRVSPFRALISTKIASTIIIENNVTSVGYGYFTFPSNVKKVVLGKDVQKIREHAFSGCQSLKVYYAGSYEDWKKVDIEKNNDVFSDLTVQFNFCMVSHSMDHTYSTNIIPATITNDGLVESKCACGKVESITKIARISSVSLSKTQYIHDGKNKTPKVTVEDNDGNILVKNVDYTIKVASSRKGIGKYTVKVNFIGDYSGSKSVYFYVKPGATSKITSTSEATAVTLKWNSVSGAAGYTVYRYSPSKKAYVKAGTTEGTSLTVKKLYADTEYTFKVVAYGKTSGGKVYNSDKYKTYKTSTTKKFITASIPTNVTFTSTENSVTLKWNDVAGAAGYRVYISEGGKWVTVRNLSDRVYTVEELASGTKYKFAIKAYAKVDGKTVWSSNFAKIDAITIPEITGSGILYVGGSKTFSATAPGSVTWSSSDKSIATVSSSGKVTAKKAGEVTISASYKFNGKTYKGTYEVTVKTPSIKLNTTSVSLAKGKSVTLKATTAPTSVTVKWKSSNTSVATVSSSGKVTAKKAGTATITASFSYGDITYSKTCKVTVTNVTTAQSNITKLVDYIKANGKVNQYGEKFIKEVEYFEDYTYTFAIVYVSAEDCLRFISSYEYDYYGGLNTTYTMDLNRTGTAVYYETIFIYDDYYGDPIYVAAATYYMNPSLYYDVYDVFDYYEENTFPDDVDIDASIYSGLETAMAVWNNMVYDAIGVGLDGIGFTNYNG